MITWGAGPPLASARSVGVVLFLARPPRTSCRQARTLEAFLELVRPPPREASSGRGGPGEYEEEGEIVNAHADEQASGPCTRKWRAEASQAGGRETRATTALKVHGINFTSPSTASYHRHQHQHTIITVIIPSLPS